MDPKVSIIMSVYNAEPYLREAVESILSQTFSNFEFVIIDDASRDSSREVLNKYAAQDSRIRIINNEHNLGLTKSLNKGIAIAKGEYIARMDADDVSLPDRFAKQVSYLDAHPNCGVVGSGADIIDANGQTTRTIIYPSSNEELQKVLIKFNPFFHSSIMVRRSALNDVGVYDESWRFAQDYELLLRIARQYQLGNIPEVLLKYREIPGSITAKKNRTQIGFVIRAKVRAIGRGQYPLYKAIYIIPMILSWLLPVSIKRYIKNMVRK